MTGTQGWKSRQKLPSVPPLGEPQDISKLTPLSFEAGIVRSTGRWLCYSATLRFPRYRVVHSLLQQHMRGFPLRAAAGNQGHPIFVKRSYLGRRWLWSLCQGQDWMGLAAEGSPRDLWRIQLQVTSLSDFDCLPWLTL